MFRIFLRKKLLSGKESSVAEIPSAPPRSSRQRNRRLYDRYNVDQKSLTILNEQDILVIKDLSAKGFSSDVSDRAFQRFALEDVYDARMRYGGSIFDLQLKVIWKRDKVVGFEIVTPSRETSSLFKRLIRPFELGSTLKEVDTEFMRNNPDGKIWFHSENDVDLYVWRNEEGSLYAWQLVAGGEYVEWNDSRGLVTGVMKQVQTGSQISVSDPFKYELQPTRDTHINKDRCQFANDIFMAMQSEYKESLLATFGG